MSATQITIPEEEWRVIPGYRDYEASSNGRLRGRSGRPLATPKANKYLQCRIRRPSGTITTRRVHILVALAFLGPKPTPDHEVNHKNGNRYDNRPDNLEYVTSLENEMHAAGWLKARGNNHGARFKKLMKELVRWYDTPAVQGAFSLSAIHGRVVSEDFSRYADRIWGMAHELTEDKPRHASWAKIKRDRALKTDGSRIVKED